MYALRRYMCYAKSSCPRHFPSRIPRRGFVDIVHTGVAATDGMRRAAICFIGSHCGEMTAVEAEVVYGSGLICIRVQGSSISSSSLRYSCSLCHGVLRLSDGSSGLSVSYL